MTSRQKASKLRPWLREEQTIISRTLKQVLAVSKEWNDDEKLIICRLYHAIVMIEPTWGEYRNVNHKIFKDISGSDYRRYVDWMVDICIKENKSYQVKHNTKSFSLLGVTETNKSTELVVIKQQSLRHTPKTDNSIATDDVSKYVLKCLNMLTVREQLVSNPIAYREAMALYSCKNIYDGCFKMQYGKNSKRLSHAVIRMVSEARCNLIFKSTGEDLVYCDIRSCFPSLITLYIKDAGERQRYIAALQVDIYNKILLDSGSKWNRDKCKTTFSKLLSDPDHRGDNCVSRWLIQHFPILWQWIAAQKNLALILQNS